MNITMKKYMIAASLLLGFLETQAQVIIDKDVNQVVSSPSVLIEFGTQPKGLLLPWVTNTAGVTGAVAGTVVYDVSDKKVKYLKGGTGGGWIDMSIDANGVVDTSLQDTPTDLPTAKTVIGDRNTAAPGILVLDSPDKAMVLPKVSRPAVNIINPSAGMMAYDTNSKQLAVFNGTVWTFWKASEVPTVTTATGRVWMDRNLGASRVATSSDDTAAFGDLYQWGRLADGHQLSNPGFTTTRSITDVPTTSAFIVNSPDWRLTPNDNLWQGVNGTNNPCPSGFRVPTAQEFEAERNTWSTQDTPGGFDSPLKLPKPTYRGPGGSVASYGTMLYWTSTVSGTKVIFVEGGNITNSNDRSFGFAVRCIKN
ncbi:MAG: hypothetical protein EOP54_24290 [Sphingobacteriales bacterium]|nr:MAG: hypothetical protein EOP54_24290 [Sphingobacteriales bacterium]